tara:strand:+ start:816 stop:965 length:150 start_codon:yes stop_codon:yes gene_type:complete
MKVENAPEQAGKAAVKLAAVGAKASFGFIKGVVKQTVKSLTTKGEKNGK